MDNALGYILVNVLVFVATYFVLRQGQPYFLRFRAKQELSFDRALRRQLMLDITPRRAFQWTLAGVFTAFVLASLLTFNLFIGLVCGFAAFFLPVLITRHLEQKRRSKLESQLVDGLTTLSSGVKAGLNFVQSVEMLVDNHQGPIKQEFAQLLREYSMGRELNEAMRAASNRIGSPLYRLTFTAIEMHRIRGGDAGQSMDRLADAVREIKKLEGKLDAITAQSRSQASMMAVMPLVFLVILYFIDREGVTLLFTETVGRILLLFCALLILGAFIWIRKIMAVEI